MGEYIFVFGRDFQLSMLEIISYFIARGIKYKINSFNARMATVSIENKLNFKKVIMDLGGTIKIARVLSSLDELELPNLNKIKYAFAVVDSDNKEQINAVLKKRFREERMKAFLKRSSDVGLSASDFHRHNIYKEGFELVLYKDLIGLTIAVFNPKEYEFRDKRPYLERKKLTSIRLAKILINLSQAKENDIMLDPFCGSATVLQEALLMGINVIGVDVDAKSIHYAKKNLKWLRNKYDFKTDFTLINKDAKSLSGYVEKVDAVATEPYLGPYLKRLPRLNDARRVAVELADLYTKVLGEIKIVLKKGIVAIVIPKFKTREQVPVYINLKDIAESQGFRVYSPFPGIKVPVLYAPKGTKLDREIYILEKL